MSQSKPKERLPKTETVKKDKRDTGKVMLATNRGYVPYNCYCNRRTWAKCSACRK